MYLQSFQYASLHCYNAFKGQIRKANEIAAWNNLEHNFIVAAKEYKLFLRCP